MKDDEGTFCALKRFLAILALFAFLHFRQFVCVCVERSYHLASATSHNTYYWV